MTVAELRKKRVSRCLARLLYRKSFELRMLWVVVVRSSAFSLCNF